jgi:hypothetical protein
MRNSLVEPLRNVFGVSDKVAQLALADLLTSAPLSKPLWLEAGASMSPIDTLVHHWMHRSGIMGRFSSHNYGPACYEPNGCADIIARVATQIDARKCNPLYPKFFPRWVQHAIWRYCAQMELNICNGNTVKRDERCTNKGCPLFDLCDRVALQPSQARTTPM